MKNKVKMEVNPRDKIPKGQNFQGTNFPRDKILKGQNSKDKIPKEKNA